MKNKLLPQLKIYKAWVLTLELSQYCKNGCTFRNASRSLHVATAADSEMQCVCLPDQPMLCQRAATAIDFAIKTFNYYLKLPSGLWSDCQMTGRGSNLGSNLKSAALLDTVSYSSYCFICSASEIPEYPVWDLISFRSAEDAKTEASKKNYFKAQVPGWQCPSRCKMQ